MTKLADKKPLTVKETIGVILFLGSLAGTWYANKQSNERQWASIKEELHIFIGEEKEKNSVSSRDIEILKADLQNTQNRTTELEKNDIRIEAVLSNYKLEIKEK